MSEFILNRNSFGRLVLTDSEGNVHEDIVPVHAFPISAPERGVALVNTAGKELAWIDNLDDLPENSRQLIQQELMSREFIPEINKINKVSTFSTPSVWEVETNRGVTRFILKAEDDIRRLDHDALLIADNHGINFLIRNIKALGKDSRKLLDRFL